MESLEKIGELLDRFYKGETSLEEEKMLQDYFSTTSVPEEFIPDKDLFLSLRSDEKYIGMPEGLNQKIIAAIDKAERGATRSKRITLFSLSGLAAGLLLMIAVYLFFFRSDEPTKIAQQQQWVDTYEDPMDAYEETWRALTYVSAKMNSAASELKHVQQVAKTADPLRSLSKLNKGSKELSLLGQLKRVKEFESQ